MNLSTRRTLLQRGLVATVGALGLLVAPPVQAQDANGIVRKMIQTYKGLKTLTENSEAKIIILGGPQQIQTTLLRYQKPSLFQIVTSDPVNGSLSITSDGKTVSLHAGRQNVYTQAKYTGNFVETVKMYEKLADEAFTMKIAQILSPIGFLMAGDMPAEAQNFRYVGTTKIVGRDVYIVHAPINAEWVYKTVGRVNLIADKSEVRLWVDKQTNLLVRSALRMAWKFDQKMPSGKSKTIVQGMLMEETHTKQEPNGNIDFANFRFAPPPGSKQVFLQKK